MPIDVKRAIKRLNDFFYPYMVDGRPHSESWFKGFGSPKEMRYDTKKLKDYLFSKNAKDLLTSTPLITKDDLLPIILSMSSVKSRVIELYKDIYKEVYDWDDEEPQNRGADLENDLYVTDMYFRILKKIFQMNREFTLGSKDIYGYNRSSLSEKFIDTLLQDFRIIGGAEMLTPKGTEQGTKKFTYWNLKNISMHKIIRQISKVYYSSTRPWELGKILGKGQEFEPDIHNTKMYSSDTIGKYPFSDVGVVIGEKTFNLPAIFSDGISSTSHNPATFGQGPKEDIVKLFPMATSLESYTSVGGGTSVGQISPNFYSTPSGNDFHKRVYSRGRTSWFDSVLDPKLSRKGGPLVGNQYDIDLISRGRRINDPDVQFLDAYLFSGNDRKKFNEKDRVSLLLDLTKMLQGISFFTIRVKAVQTERNGIKEVIYAYDSTKKNDKDFIDEILTAPKPFFPQNVAQVIHLKYYFEQAILSALPKQEVNLEDKSLIKEVYAKGKKYDDWYKTSFPNLLNNKFLGDLIGVMDPTLDFIRHKLDKKSNYTYESAKKLREDVAKLDPFDPFGISAAMMEMDASKNIDTKKLQKDISDAIKKDVASNINDLKTNISNVNLKMNNLAQKVSGVEKRQSDTTVDAVLNMQQKTTEGVYQTMDILEKAMRVLNEQTNQKMTKLSDEQQAQKTLNTKKSEELKRAMQGLQNEVNTIRDDVNTIKESSVSGETNFNNRLNEIKKDLLQTQKNIPSAPDISKAEVNKLLAEKDKNSMQEISKLQKELLQQKQIAETLGQKLSEANTHIAGQSINLSDMQKQIKDTKIEIGQKIIDTQSALGKRIDNTQKDISTKLRQTQTDLKKDISTKLQQTQTDLKKQISETDQRIKQTESNIGSQLKQTQEDLSKTKQQVNETGKQLDKTKNDIDQQIRKTQLDINNTRQKVSEAENTIENAKAELAKQIIEQGKNFTDLHEKVAKQIQDNQTLFNTSISNIKEQINKSEYDINKGVNDLKNDLEKEKDKTKGLRDQVSNNIKMNKAKLDILHKRVNEQIESNLKQEQHNKDVNNIINDITDAIYDMNLNINEELNKRDKPKDETQKSIHTSKLGKPGQKLSKSFMSVDKNDPKDETQKSIHTSKLGKPGQKLSKSYSDVSSLKDKLDAAKKAIKEEMKRKSGKTNEEYDNINRRAEFEGARYSFSNPSDEDEKIPNNNVNQKNNQEQKLDKSQLDPRVDRKKIMPQAFSVETSTIIGYEGEKKEQKSLSISRDEFNIERQKRQEQQAFTVVPLFRNDYKGAEKKEPQLNKSNFNLHVDGEKKKTPQLDTSNVNFQINKQVNRKKHNEEYDNINRRAEFEGARYSFSNPSDEDENDLNNIQPQPMRKGQKEIGVNTERRKTNARQIEDYNRINDIHNVNARYAHPRHVSSYADAFHAGGVYTNVRGTGISNDLASTAVQTNTAEERRLHIMNRDKLKVNLTGARKAEASRERASIRQRRF